MLGVESAFDGTVYDAPGGPYAYASTPGERATYRPFYAILIGQPVYLQRLFRTVEGSTTVQPDRFVLISPTVISDSELSLEKPRESEGINVQSARDNRFKILNGFEAGTLRGTLRYEPAPAAAFFDPDVIELAAYRRGPGHRDSVRTRDLELDDIEVGDGASRSTSTSSRMGARARTSTSSSSSLATSAASRPPLGSATSRQPTRPRRPIPTRRSTSTASCPTSSTPPLPSAGRSSAAPPYRHQAVAPAAMRSAPLNYLLALGLAGVLWIVASFVLGNWLGDNVSLLEASVAEFVGMYRTVLTVAPVLVSRLRCTGSTSGAARRRRCARQGPPDVGRLFWTAFGAAVVLVIVLVVLFSGEQFALLQYVVFFLAVSAVTYFLYWLSTLLFSPRTVMNCVRGRS